MRSSVSQEIIQAVYDYWLQSDSDVIQRNALDAIRTSGDCSLFVLAPKNGTPEVRERAANALGEIGQAIPEVIRTLLAALNDSDVIVRWSAAEALGKLGQASPEVISALLAALKDINLSVRWSAAVALGMLGQASPEVISALLAALNDSDAFVRREATKALGKIASTSDVVIALSSMGLNPDSEFHDQCMESLARIGRRIKKPITP